MKAFAITKPVYEIKKNGVLIAVPLNRRGAYYFEASK